jgi:carbonic anhydrase
VLGHSQCGAITATLEALRRPSQIQSRGLRSIVERVRPSVQELFETPLRDDWDSLVRHAVRANIRASVAHLQHGSETLEQLHDEAGLLIVGAEYNLESGYVEFLDGATSGRGVGE